jgi:hypothetical protein
MSAAIFTKDPDERLDYEADYSRWLPGTDTIASATAEIAEGTAVIDAVEPSDAAVRIWVSGGTPGETCRITIRATTVQGRIKEAALRIKIKETA